MDIQEFLAKGHLQFLPNLSIDHVIIGYDQGRLKCLLLRLGDRWILPGGYIQRTETVAQAAKRILKERTHLENPHQQFLAVFGATDRQFATQWKPFLAQRSIPWRDDYWINDRFVTLAYYSLVHMEQTQPVPSAIDDAIDWFDFEALPEMWMDHQHIVQTAREQLKHDLLHEQLSYHLLPDQFTMPELHQLHQHILGKNIDRSRFQKKMLASGDFERLPKLQNEVPGRNPYLYRVKHH